MGLELLLLALAARAIARHLSRSSSASDADPSVPPTPRPEKIITFVGAAGAGKSSTINAVLGYEAFLVGAEHGSTNRVSAEYYRSGYRLCDTPGLMDATDYSALVWNAIAVSELVIYTTVGQLYRPEQEFLGKIMECQRCWDAETQTPGRRQLALYVNQQDIKEMTMPRAVCSQEAEAICRQVAAWLPADRVLFGAAAPISQGERQSPRLTALQSFIDNYIDTHAEVA